MWDGGAGHVPVSLPSQESMGLDWQGPHQYQRLENALKSKSIELLDGELLI